jgi:hypothetical protein
MKAYWGSGCMIHAFLTSALDVGEWSASRIGLFTSREKAPGTHWIGGWVNPSASGEKKIPKPLPGLKPPINQPVA